MKLSDVRFDSAQVDGIWVTFYGDLEFLIAREGNPEYNEAMRVALRPHAEEARDSELTDQTFEELRKRVSSEHVVKGWRNMQDDEGNEIEYSPEKAYEILNDPAYEELWLFVVVQSRKYEKYRRHSIKRAEGNSLNGSTGKLSGVASKRTSKRSSEEESESKL